MVGHRHNGVRFATTWIPVEEVTLLSFETVSTVVLGVGKKIHVVNKTTLVFIEHVIESFKAPIGIACEIGDYRCGEAKGLRPSLALVDKGMAWLIYSDAKLSQKGQSKA
jgi:hypothetical protein